MDNQQFIDTGEALFHLSYHKGGELRLMSYEHVSYETIIQGVRPQFTVNLFDKKLYIIVQELSGHISLTSNETGKWQSKRLQKQPHQNDVTMAALMGQRPCIIFNITEESERRIDRRDFLAMSRQGNRGEWMPPQTVGPVSNSVNGLFHTQNTGDSHLLLFYHLAGEEETFGYREVNPSGWGNFQGILKNAASIVDYSMLTTKKAINGLFIRRGLFSGQLLFWKKDDNRPTAPQILWEGQRLESCQVAIIRNLLYCFFVVGGMLFYVVSTDGGDSFSRPTKYNLAEGSLVKIPYVSNGTMDEAEFFVREVYVHRHEPTKVLILPDICDSFGVFKKPKAEPAPYNQVQPQIQTQHAQENQQPFPDEAYYSFFNQGFAGFTPNPKQREVDNEIITLSNRIEKLISELYEKDQTIRSQQAELEQLRNEIKEMKLGQQQPPTNG